MRQTVRRRWLSPILAAGFANAGGWYKIYRCASFGQVTPLYIHQLMSSVTAVKQALPYFLDSAELFAPLANRPWAVFLDSTDYQGNQQGRFDIMAYAPVCTLQTFGATTIISQNGVETQSQDDPFQLLKQQLGPPRPSIGDLPFNGGAIGYFAYDLARQIEHLPVLAADAEQIADMAIGIYHWAVIVDHHLRQSWLIAYDLDADTLASLIDQFSRLPASDTAGEFKVLQAPRSNMDKASYAAAFAKIKAYLKEGDSYQVNLTQRFSSPCQGDVWSAYELLRKINAAPFSAFLNLPDVQVLSSSPERFLKVTR